MERQDDESSKTVTQTFLRLLHGYRVSQLIYAAAKMGLSDLLAAGPQSVDVLAHHTGTGREDMEAILLRLAEVGVFREVSDGGFDLTPMGSLLRSDVMGSLRASAIAAGEVDYRTWGELLHQLQADESAFARAHSEGWFEYYARTSDGQIYRDMVESAQPIAEDFLRTCDLSGIQRLVDVGGGYGAFLVAVLQARPALTGVVYDLPAIQTEAECYIASSGVADRCTFSAGSFFQAVPEGADTYILLRVLRNWGDGEATAILANCRSAMPAHGRVLLVDPVLEVRREPVPLQLEARRFLRTHSELRTLLAAVDFEVIGVTPISDWGSVVEAVPAGHGKRASSAVAG